ncbi:MAG TPA: CoA transferase, partial [Dehalococcoidia bacterium]|nr:CoA transferase [Dehalococcoidia bacterium]
TSCTQALAWFGADVVKVEQPGTGEPGRGVALGTDNSPYFCNWNSNKRSVALNLADPNGRELFLEMVPHYDVFVENYGPGVIEKLGLNYEDLKAVHPGIIYARLKGFGTSGPYSGYKSYDSVAQAAAGAFSVTGEPGGPPMRPGPTVGDSGTGVQLGMAILAAYVQKLRTGQGQVIEISMQEAMTYYMRTVVAIGAEWGLAESPRTGNALGAPTNLYPCKPFGPNDYLFIMVVTTRMWDTLCAAIDRPELTVDPRFADGPARLENAAALTEEVSKWTRERTKSEAMRELGALGVPCSANLSTADLFTDPHLVERGFIHEVEHDSLGPIKLLGWAPRMSESDVPMKAAPLLGQHTDDVLKSDLDLPDARLASLRESGVLG